MIRRLQDNIEGTMNKNEFQIETITESRSWKERKKSKHNEVLHNTSNIKRHLQSFNKPFTLKSSDSTEEIDFPKHNHVPRLRGEDTITIYSHFSNNLCAIYLSIFAQQLLICMPNFMSLFCNDEKCSKQEYFDEKYQKLWKQKKKENYSFCLYSNLMGVCSQMTKVLSLMVFLSTFGTSCYGLKNEFCKFNDI